MPPHLPRPAPTPSEGHKRPTRSKRFSEPPPARAYRRVVVSGGPAAGKTAILELLRRHLANEVAVVPESATLLFAGGFPRRRDEDGVKLVQRAIFEVQRCSEAIHVLGTERRACVCDRGSLDGAAYFPGGLDSFCDAMGTTIEDEYDRYDGVLFLESTAYQIETWPTDNPHRIETPAEARKIDRKLKHVWEGHPNFQLVPHAATFYEKISTSLEALHRMLGIDGVLAVRREIDGKR